MGQDFEPEVKMIPVDQEVLAYSPKAIKESLERCKKNIATYENAKQQQLQEMDWLKRILARRRDLEDQGISIESLKRK